LKIITWNVNGLRAALKKGVVEWIAEQSPDVMCLQETRVLPEQLDEEQRSVPGYGITWNPAQKKGYSGVGIYTRIKPNKVITNLGIPDIDDEGRYLELDFDSLIVISVYLPSGSSGEDRQIFKYQVLDKINKIFEVKINQGKDIVICGDFNIAHQDIDLKNFKGNRKNSGFLPDERAWLTDLFSRLGFYDIYRQLYPSLKQTTVGIGILTDLPTSTPFGLDLGPD